MADILVINIGSTSDKVAVYRDETPLFSATIDYAPSQLPPDLEDQLPQRQRGVEGLLSRRGVSPREIDLVVSRGGLARPLPAGIYRINAAMCRDLLSGRYGKHPSSLGPVIAFDFSRRYGIEALVVDPPSTDEFHPLARISGLPEIERRSAFHALSQKSAARRAAKEMGRAYEELNLVVAHLGGGITVGAHLRGQVVDATHGLGEGPFTPERAGSLPTTELLELAFSGRYTREELGRKLVGQGGLMAYLGTNDARTVEERIDQGDERARLIYQALAYQVAKEIGALATVLRGKVDAVGSTGRLAHSQRLVG